MLITSVLIFGNWSIWIYAVATNKIIDASFGYFIFPIISVFFGYLFFKEKLNKKRIISISLVIISTIYLLFNFDSLPWIGFAVAFLWSIYNLLRKKIVSFLDGIESLTPETVCLLAKSVVNEGDGLVARLPDNPEDPICVFRIQDEYFGIRDVCPHAGFALADGEFDATTGIVTCPEHGSRFDVHSGERIQGPADYSIKTYPIKVDGDDIYVYV